MNEKDGLHHLNKTVRIVPPNVSFIRNVFQTFKGVTEYCKKRILFFSLLWTGEKVSEFFLKVFIFVAAFFKVNNV